MGGGGGGPDVGFRILSIYIIRILSIIRISPVSTKNPLRRMSNIRDTCMEVMSLIVLIMSIAFFPFSVQEYDPQEFPSFFLLNQFHLVDSSSTGVGSR